MGDEDDSAGERDHGEYRISLRVWHPSLTGEQIVDIVKREPRVVQTVGQPRMTRAGKLLKGLNETSFCTFEIGRGPIPDVEKVLLGEAERISQLGQLTEISRADGARVEFFIGIFLRDNTGFIVPADTSRVLAELGIDLHFDMYCDRD